jgi:hypothetical protein
MSDTPTGSEQDWFTEEQVLIRPQDRLSIRGKKKQTEQLVRRRSAPGRDLPEITAPFVYGPVDAVWSLGSYDAGIDAARVGLALWRVVGITKNTTFRFSSGYRDDLQLTRRQVHRGLTALEKAGLITISREGLRTPIVTLVTPLTEYFTALRDKRAKPTPPL